MDYKRSLKDAKNTAIYLGILFMIRILRLMNRRTSIAFMRYVGRMVFIFARGERNRTINHLRHAYHGEKSDEEIMMIARSVFLNFSVCAADAVRLPLLVKDGTIDRIVSIDNFHNLTDVISSGSGAIIMTGHYSNWELMGTWVVRQGYPIKVVAKKSYDPRLDKLIVDYRNQAGYANTARGSAKYSVVEGLMNGEVYGLLFDLDTKVKGVFVDFFGRPAHTATVPAMLSQKLQVPIIPMFIRLKPDYTYHISCLEALDIVDTGDEQSDIITNTQTCSDVYEKVIRDYPDQWIWMHQRWKKQPFSNMVN